MSGARPLRLAVYTDYAYHRLGEQVYSERAFSVFVSRLAEDPGIESLTVIGRLDPTPARARYRLGSGTRFVPLPFYPRLSEPGPAIRAMARSLRAFWGALPGCDAAWLLGPHPLAVLFALLAAVRGKRVVLGVRQDSVSYVRNRHPASRIAPAAAMVLDGLYRLLGRFCDVVAVGPGISRDYRHSRRLLEIAVSLVEEGEIVAPEVAAKKDYSGPMRVLSVGRIDPEKNPLMLADVLGALRREDPRWSLVVCGEGSLESELAERLGGLGLDGSAELKGYLGLDDGLRELYRDCHVLLHVSWTEGLPQILFEAFAAGLPVVATDVGGIAAAVGPAVSLVPPGDPAAAAAAVAAVASEPARRSEMLQEGNRIARMQTIQSETSRLARFLGGG
jgi:glycosyltransferase involved in cell wall biosynthesis